MRCILLVLDGLGDKGHACFKRGTPLEVASTPNLDHLASLGMNGLYHSYYQGTAMPSELAHFLMFGYEIDEFPGRGLIEAVGEGITIHDGDVSLLARIFSVRLQDGMLMLEKEDPDVDRNSCRVLQKAIRLFHKDGIEIEFIPTKGIEGMLVLRGLVSAHITDSNPIYEGRPLMQVIPFQGKDVDKSVVLTARVLNHYLTWCYHTLSEHPLNIQRLKEGLCPINAVGTQRAGMRRNIMPFRDKWGLRALSIASGSIYHGLCSLLGIDVQKVRDTGDVEKDLLERLKIAKNALNYEWIHVHTKAPDQAAHKRNPEHKKDVIESLDRTLAYAVDEIITDEDVLLVVTSDHSTASAGSMIHSGETVPLTMVGKYTRRDDVAQFNEVSCAKGGLGLVRGKELMYLILNFLDRGKLWGLMDSPVNQPFFPGYYKPLRIE